MLDSAADILLGEGDTSRYNEAEEVDLPRSRVVSLRHRPGSDRKRRDLIDSSTNDIHGNGSNMPASSDASAVTGAEPSENADGHRGEQRGEGVVALLEELAAAEQGLLWLTDVTDNCEDYEEKDENISKGGTSANAQGSDPAEQQSPSSCSKITSASASISCGTVALPAVATLSSTAPLSASPSAPTIPSSASSLSVEPTLGMAALAKGLSRGVSRRAAAWMDSQIRILVDELLKIGKEHGDGLCASDMSELARATAERIDSFMGVMEAAVGRGVIKVLGAGQAQEARVVLLRSIFEDADEHTCM